LFATLPPRARLVGQGEIVPRLDPHQRAETVLAQGQVEVAFQRGGGGVAAAEIEIGVVGIRARRVQAGEAGGAGIERAEQARILRFDPVGRAEHHAPARIEVHSAGRLQRRQGQYGRAIRC
jgi:hypothetical protein